MSKILIVEDEPAMQIGLRDNLEFEGYSVHVASDGELGLKEITTNNYDLVVLDVMLPKISGFDVCKKARAQGVETPIILLTARGEEIDKVLGLELGADDYMTKPFSLRELLARIKANLRRSPKVSGQSQGIVTVGNLKIDFEAYKAVSHNSNETIKLSHKEFEIIKYLFDNKYKVVSRF